MEHTSAGLAWTTAQVAAQLGVPASTIRFWVRSGLVEPTREVNHSYLFDDAALEKFRYIHKRRQAKVGLAEIARELTMFTWQTPSQPDSPVRTDSPGERQKWSSGTLAGAKRPRVLVLANQKGGVGKTTSAINLGASLVTLGHRVLIVDWDPQANASQALGLTHDETDGGPSVFDCVGENCRLLPEVIRPTGLSALDLAPANIQLSGLELDLANTLGRESALRSILQRQELPYDCVIIDTPPTLGLITLNALVAGDGVVIPVQAEYLSLEGIRQLVNTIQVVKERLNPELAVASILITMFDAEEPLAQPIRKRIEEVFSYRVPTAVVPRSPHVVAAQMEGVPLAQFAPDSEVAQAYAQVAGDLASFFDIPSRWAQRIEGATGEKRTGL